MIMPVAMMIMAQVAGPQRMGRVMGFVSMPAMIAPILGPVVGGVILEYLHWSWIFFVNVPIGVIASARLAAAAAHRLRRRRTPGHSRPGDASRRLRAVIYGIGELGSGSALGSADGSPRRSRGSCGSCSSAFTPCASFVRCSTSVCT